MARHKLKPNLDIDKEISEIIRDVSEYFGKPYDDRHPTDSHVSLKAVARHFNTSFMKVRKILITAGMYTVETERNINHMIGKGMTIEEIADAMSMTPASVYSYIPYSKGIYNLTNKTVDADRQTRYRERKKKKKGTKDINE